MTFSSLPGNRRTYIWCSGGEGGVTVQELCQFVLAMDSSGCVGLAVGTHPE